MATANWKERLAKFVRETGESIGPEDIAALVVATYVFMGMLRRLRYGVDATDEAFYCVLTHRYALGDWPYLDEVNLRQTAGLFAVPVYWLWIKARGSTDGVVLLLRGVYFVIACGVGAIIYSFARDRISRAASLLVALTAIAFFPFALPTCNYNNLGCLLFTTGTVLALRGVTYEGKRARRFHYWSGIAHGLTLVAHPAYIVPVIAFAGFQLAGARTDRWQRTFRYALGGVTIGFFFALILARAGAKGVREAFEYETTLLGPRTESKLQNVFNDLLNHAPLQNAVFPLVLAWIAAAKTWKPFRIWGTLALVPLLAWIYAPVLPLPPSAPGVTPWRDTTTSLATAAQGLDQHIRCIYYAAYTCLAGAMVFPLLPRGSMRREFVVIGWLPSLVAAVMCGYASANTGAINFGLGAFSGAVVVLVAIPVAIGKGNDEPQPSRDTLRSKLLGAVLMASLATAGLAHLRYARHSVYRDQPVETLSAKVTTGPYEGLITTPENVDRMNVMVRKLRQLERPNGKVFAYYDYPGAYLMTLMRPAMPTAWTDSRMPINEFMIRRYKRNLTGSGFVVRMKGVENLTGRGRFEEIVESPQRLQFEDAYFKVYAEPDPSLLP